MPVEILLHLWYVHSPFSVSLTAQLSSRSYCNKLLLSTFPPKTSYVKKPTDQAVDSVGLMEILAEHQIKTESLLAGITEQDLSDMKLVVGQKILVRRLIARLSKSSGDNFIPPMSTGMEEVTSNLPSFKLEEEPANIKVLYNMYLFPSKLHDLKLRFPQVTQLIRKVSKCHLYSLSMAPIGKQLKCL